MKLLPLDRGMTYYRVEGLATYAKLLARLKADHPLVALWLGLMEEWVAMFQQELTARDNIVISQGAVEVRDDDLDFENTNFAGHVYLRSNRDRKSTLYKSLCPVPSSELNRKNTRLEAQFIKQTIVPEVRKLGPDDRLAPFADGLDELATASLQALDARDAAKAQLNLVNNDVRAWKERVNEARINTYAELLKIANSAGHSRSWADSFFRTESHQEIEDSTAGDSTGDGAAAAQDPAAG